MLKLWIISMLYTLNESKYAPTVEIQQPLYSVYTGSTVTLVSTLTVSIFFPATKVYWQKNISGSITTINSTTNANKYLGSTTLVPSLTIFNVALSDAGTYTCFATNTLGTGQTNPTKLSVTSIYYTWGNWTNCFDFSGRSIQIRTGFRNVTDKPSVSRQWRPCDTSDGQVSTTEETEHCSPTSLTPNQDKRTGSTTEVQEYDSPTSDDQNRDIRTDFKWAKLKNLNLTTDEKREMMKEELEEIRANLTVNAKNTSQAIRKRTCARDDRQSAATIGYVGALILAIPVVLIVLSDCTRCSGKSKKTPKRKSSRIEVVAEKVESRV